MENNNKKLLLSLTKNKTRFRYINSSKKMIIKNYNPAIKKLLFPKKLQTNEFLYKNNRFSIINKTNKKNSSSSGKKIKRNLSPHISDFITYSQKKNKSINNNSNNHIPRLKNKLLYNLCKDKDSNFKKERKNKIINYYSFTNCNLLKNKLCKKIIPENYKNNTLIENNYFFNKSNYNNYINNTSFLPLKNTHIEKMKLNHIITTEPYSLIHQRNKSLFKSNTYSNLEIICEGINNNANNINTHINNINNLNIHTMQNKPKKIEITPKIQKNIFKIFENKRMKRNKSNSYMFLTSINNNNYTNILNYNFSKKKNSKKKKVKIKLNKSHNKTLNENEIKYKLNELKIKMEQLFVDNEKSSKSAKYNIIKDKFVESINIMGLNKDEKNFLKLIINKYNDIICSYSKENKILKKASEQFQNLNLKLDKKYSDLENKYNQNLNLLKQLQQNDNNIIYK